MAKTSNISITEHVVDDFMQLIEYINKNCEEEDILFRGQQEDLPLLPKLGRKNIKFRGKRLNVESKMLQQFRLECCPYLDGNIKSDLEFLLLAQHHGLPTRLLDWTKNPLAALWFSVRKPAVDKKPAVVWIFKFGKKHLLNQEFYKKPFKVDKTKIVRPMHIARRIVAQFGWFTIHANNQKNTFVPFENDWCADKLTKLIIPVKSFRYIRWHLDRCGITEASLFPDLDGLCRHIEWLHTYLEDEYDPQPPDKTIGHKKAQKKK